MQFVAQVIATYCWKLKGYTRRKSTLIISYSYCVSVLLLKPLFLAAVRDRLMG